MEREIVIHARQLTIKGPGGTLSYSSKKSKGSVSQLMDDLDLIIEQVEVMVNSIQKGVENVLRK